MKRSKDELLWEIAVAADRWRYSHDQLHPQYEPDVENCPGCKVRKTALPEGRWTYGGSALPLRLPDGMD